MISTQSPLNFSPTQQLNPGFVSQFSNQAPDLMLLLQQLLAMTGGQGSPGFCSPMQQGNFGGGGDGFSSGGGGGFSAGGSPATTFEGFSGGGGASSSSPGPFSGGGSGATRGFVGGGDSYVPGGFEATGRGGSVGNSQQGENAVSWAESQLGVSERNNPGTVRSYSRGNWQAWCADFVSTALNKAGANKMGHQSSVAGILAWGKKNDRFTSAKAAAKNPGSLKVGDIAAWKSAGKSHVGLVTGVDAKTGKFTTIEGNTSDKVARRSHSFNSRGLTGFVRATDDKAGSKSRGKKSADASGSSSASKGASASKGSGSSKGSGGGSKGSSGSSGSGSSGKS